MSNVTIVLSEEQQKALDTLIKWANDLSANNVASLSGSAGTGKTTVLKFFVSNFRNKDLAVSAPTHKAKKVAEKSTNVEGKTIQSLLGLRPNTELENFDIANPQFDNMAEPQIPTLDIVIVDEASMINSDLYELLESEARKYNVKLLFVGDRLQLPPIGEKLSKVFTAPGIQCKLETIVRQNEGNPLLKVLSVLRQDMIDNTTNYINHLQTNTTEEGGIYVTKDNKEFLDWILENYSIVDPEHAKFIAWRNKTVSDWSYGIRRKLFPEDYKNPIILGDNIVGYKSILTDYSMVLINSENYTISKIKETITKFGVPVYQCKIEDPDGVVSVINIVKSDGYKEFLEAFYLKLNTAKKYRGMSWVKFYEFKNEHLIHRDIWTKNRDRKICPKDLDYGYGITVHKSQGSTYNSVFVNLKDINKNRDPMERLKLTYVALSRASENAFILI